MGSTEGKFLQLLVGSTEGKVYTVCLWAEQRESFINCVGGQN